MDTTVTIAILGLFGTIVAGLFKIIDSQNKAFRKISESLDKNTESNKKIAKENKKIADANIRSADEAEKRNGHIVEVILESKREALAKIDKLQVETEKVKVQNVRKQIVQNKE